MRKLTEQQVEQALREAQDFFKEQVGDDEATLLALLVGADEYRRLMACPTDRLPAFIDDRVSADERERIKVHLTVCSFCREDVEETRALVADWQRGRWIERLEAACQEVIRRGGALGERLRDRIKFQVSLALPMMLDRVSGVARFAQEVVSDLMPWTNRRDVTAAGVAGEEATRDWPAVEVWTDDLESAQLKVDAETATVTVTLPHSAGSPLPVILLVPEGEGEVYAGSAEMVDEWTAEKVFEDVAAGRYLVVVMSEGKDLFQEVTRPSNSN